MPPREGPHPAALVLLTLAVLGGGCQGAGPGDEILFACESNERCGKKDHVCAPDGLCRPRSNSFGASPFSIWDMQDEAVSASPAAGGAGQASYTSSRRPGVPPGERADARCLTRCARRQADCTASCGEGTKCRQVCGRTTDDCYARCRRTDDAREAARQRRDVKHCMDGAGRPRRCSASEEQQLRAAMKRASELLCLDERGEPRACPEQLEKLEAARRFIPKDCHATGCDGDVSE